MRLSEAIMLGDVLRKRDSSIYLHVNGSGEACGSAIGGAYLALGHRRFNQDCSEFPWLLDVGPDGRNSWRAEIGCAEDISFDRVMKGKITFERFVDWVRSIEPSCGDCNCFTCICKSEELPEAMETVYEKATL